MKTSLWWKRSISYGLSALIALIVILTIAHYPDHFDDLSAESTLLDRPDYKEFYGSAGSAFYGVSQPSSSEPKDEGTSPGSHESYPYAAPLRAFVEQYGLEKAHVLEVGSGAGALQDIVADYTGLDIAGSLRRLYHKPFVEASATSMPFRDGEFDAIWTINVLEHVPKPELALHEMRRVLRDKGLLYLQAAWQCRSWAAEGYEVRPYSDFGIQGKLIKASIPLRDSTAYRALYTFPIRLVRLIDTLLSDTPTNFHYNLLTPNYKHFWQPDSDAVNSMDAYEAILWFRSRGDEVLRYDGLIDPFFIRTGTIVIRVNKPTMRLRR
jgi:SAM-dependent methyltransferase